jgi:hypothetical protein
MSRISADFDLTRQRVVMAKRLLADGERKFGVNGICFATSTFRYIIGL